MPFPILRRKHVRTNSQTLRFASRREFQKSLDQMINPAIRLILFSVRDTSLTLNTPEFQLILQAIHHEILYYFFSSPRSKPSCVGVGLSLLNPVLPCCSKHPPACHARSGCLVSSKLFRTNWCLCSDWLYRSFCRFCFYPLYFGD